MKRKIAAVIMAGGSGTRFWPLSRKKQPKQLLNLGSEDKTMIAESIDRISTMIDTEDIFIITGSHLLDPIRKAVPSVPPENVIAEPHKRNTAPCLALAASILEEKYTSEGYAKNQIVMAVLTADQLISPIEGFAETVKTATDFAFENEELVTIGIPPSRPETGYGYIETEHPFEKSESDVIAALRFHEKPNIDKAKLYLGSGRYLWNSGMFFWRLDVFVNSIIKCFPEVGNKIPEMRDSYKNKTDKALDGPNPAVDEIFAEMPNESIDFGLMEKADNVAVCRARFDWDDIGSWDSLDRTHKRDENGNVIQGNSIVHNQKNSIVINQSEKIVVSAFGGENLVVVVTDDAVMVCPKDRVQEVKKTVSELKQSGKDKWL